MPAEQAPPRLSVSGSVVPPEAAEPRRLMAAVRDPSDPSVFSGLPHYFLEAAVKGGLLDGPVPLPPEGESLPVRRIIWNLTRPLVGDRPGGYRYAARRRERQWAPVRSSLGGSSILMAWQLFPRSVVHDDSIEKWFFIDQTLTDLYKTYEEGKIIGRRVARIALADEREGYEAARGIIMHSQWAARSVVGDYGIDPAKVHVVTQAANFDDQSYAAWESEQEARREQGLVRRPEDRPLSLVFVGLEGHRKGLDRLLRGLAVAQRDGSKATVRIIGCPPELMPPELRNLPGVEWCGRIDKRKAAVRFLQLLSECDVGVLLSRIEAGGCGLWEYQAAGLAVLGTNAGGAAEQILPGTGSIVDTQAGDEEVAAAILHLERDPEAAERMREAAWAQRRSALWGDRVREIMALWPRPTGTRD